MIRTTSVAVLLYLCFPPNGGSDVECTSYLDQRLGIRQRQARALPRAHWFGLFAWFLNWASLFAWGHSNYLPLPGWLLGLKPLAFSCPASHLQEPGLALRPPTQQPGTFYRVSSLSRPASLCHPQERKATRDNKNRDFIKAEKTKERQSQHFNFLLSLIYTQEIWQIITTHLNELLYIQPPLFLQKWDNSLSWSYKFCISLSFVRGK